MSAPMMPSKRFWLLLAATCVLAAATGFMVVQWRRASALQTKLKTLSVEVAEPRQRIQEARTTGGRISAPELSSTPATPSPSSGVVPPPGSADAAASRESVRSEAERADLRSTFGLLFYRLNLSPETAAAVIDCIARHNEATHRIVREQSVEHGGDPSNPAASSARARLDEENARHARELEALIGPDSYREFEQYQRALPFHRQVAELAAHVHDTDTPLTRYQADRLTDILVSAATTPEGQIGRSVRDWDLVFAQASTVLSPLQLEVFQARKERRESWIRLNRLRATAAKAKQ